MITKFIRKLFGQEASESQETPSSNGQVVAEAASHHDADIEQRPPKRPSRPRADSAPSKHPGIPAMHAAHGAPAEAKPARKATARKPKDRDHQPTVVPASEHGIDPALISKNAVRVTDTLQQAGFRAFIVGGAVRDLLLGVAPKDFDVATDATPTEVQRLFRRARVIGRRFQIVHVQFGQELIEVSTFRALVDPKDPPEALPKDAPPPGAPQEVPLGGTSERRQRREELDRRTHAVDASGRVLRDNVWGEQHEDATRRDFTINAMYYDPATQTVLDYHHGMADIRAHLLRMIGDPATRYREDPVRMLRVVRFAAKLDFDIETHTRAPIQQLADLINNVPAARLFDEMLKLLLSGHAYACLKRLREEGLHHGLLPLLDVILENPQGERFITLALRNTDARVRAGKPVSPGFLFATLLWHDMSTRSQQYVANGEYPVPAMNRAMDDVLEMQTEKLAIHKRYSADMREIWGLQLRLEKRGRGALKLLEHPRFRAAYDFLLLRCESGELDDSVGQWWTDFIEGDVAAREALFTQGSASGEKKPRRRRRRGGAKRHAGAGEGAAGDASPDVAAAPAEPGHGD